MNVEDYTKFTNYASDKDWTEDGVIESIRNRIVPPGWSKGARRNQTSEANSEDDGDNDVYGDFEDLETGEKHAANETDDAGKETDDKEDETAIEERRLKKLALRAKFDAEYPFYFNLLFLDSISVLVLHSPLST